MCTTQKHSTAFYAESCAVRANESFGNLPYRQQVACMAYYYTRSRRRSYGRRPRRYYRAMPSYTTRRRRRTTTRSTRRRATSSRRRSAVAERACSCPKMLDAGEKWAAAQVDPFDPKVYGGKIPDSNTVPSCSVANLDLVPLSLTDQTKVNCWAFLPRVQRGRMITATEGAASWSWIAAYGGNSSFTKSTDYSAAYELDRPVAHGIRLSSSIPPTSAQGFVHIAIAYESFSNNGATTWPWPTTIAGLANYQFYRRVTLASLTQAPLTIVNKYMDETAFRYSDCSDVTGAAGAATGTLQTFHTFFSWGAILVAVEGVGATAATASTPLNCEVLLHTEAIPKSTGAVSGSPAAPYRPNIISGASNMSANMEAAFTPSQRPSVAAQASEYFAAGASNVGATIRSNAEQTLRSWAYEAGQRAATAAVGLAAAYAGLGDGGLPGINNDRLVLTR